MLSYLYTPLEENEILQKQTGIKEDYDEIQHYIMRKYSKLHLLPDNANKIFSNMKNSTSFIDDILLEISKEYHNRIHVFQCDRDGLYNNFLFDDGNKFSDNIRYQNKDLFFIEYFECDYFGHYGACKIEDGNMYIYDSMMFAEPHILNDEDFTMEFIHIVRTESKLPVYKIIKDCNHRGYSMEITGGCLDVNNEYVSSDDKQWKLDMKYLGVDNQNQFCYMWSIMYLLFKSANKNFPKFLTSICDNKQIPLVIIKTFIYNLLKYLKPKYTYISQHLNLFFNTHFYTYTSNALVYDLDKTNVNSIFCDQNRNFMIYNMDIPNENITCLNDLI